MRVLSFPPTWGGQVHQDPSLGTLSEWSLPVAFGPSRRRQALGRSHLEALIYPSPKEIFITGTLASVEINNDAASLNMDIGVDLGNPIHDVSASIKEIPAVRRASAGIREDPLY